MGEEQREDCEEGGEVVSQDAAIEVIKDSCRTKVTLVCVSLGIYVQGK